MANALSRRWDLPIGEVSEEETHLEICLFKSVQLLEGSTRAGIGTLWARTKGLCQLKPAMVQEVQEAAIVDDA